MKAILKALGAIMYGRFLLTVKALYGRQPVAVSQLNPETKQFVRYRHDPQNPKSLRYNTVSRICEDDQGIRHIRYAGSKGSL